jgi:hypothetical protein
MGQVTIYIDDDTERKLLNMIDKSGISKSKWIAELIREKTSTTWPENVVKLAGAWSDLPTAEEIRKEMGKDADREPL